MASDRLLCDRDNIFPSKINTGFEHDTLAFPQSSVYVHCSQVSFFFLKDFFFFDLARLIKGHFFQKSSYFKNIKPHSFHERGARS